MMVLFRNIALVSFLFIFTISCSDLHEEEITKGNDKVSLKDKLIELGRPVIIIQTPDSVEIESKDIWMEGATFEIYNTDGSKDCDGSLAIKGRGNSTWLLPKKPYALKLDKKNNILGFPNHKRFCLLAEYNDIGWLRNDLVFSFSRELSNLEWTPRSEEVNLIFNGEYRGLYLLTEQIKIDKNRVNVGDNGFIIEIDYRAKEESEEDPLFYVDHISSALVVKDYDETESSLEYIQNYIKKVDAVLFSDKYLDVKDGYKTLIDIDSFVEWYLIAEITKNSDYCFFSSCYMNLGRDYKLKMGPLWDFDRSLGWYTSEEGDLECIQPEGFYIKEYVDWYIRMFSDPDFVSAVKKRFNYYYSSKNQICDILDSIVDRTSSSYTLDFDLWHSDLGDCKSFRKARVDYLKQWLNARLDWMQPEIKNL